MTTTIIELLTKSKLNTAENHRQVSAHPHPQLLETAVSRLSRAKVLTQANFDDMISHPYPHDLTALLFNLHRLGLLTTEHRAMISAHPQPYSLNCSLEVLKHHRLLDKIPFKHLASHPKPFDFVSAIAALKQARILTSTHYQRLIDTANHSHPILELKLIQDQVALYNSVIHSAIRLKIRYNDDLDIDGTIAEIMDLDDSLEYQVIKRCILRISAPGFILDEESQLSMRNLLALVYTGLHDDLRRRGSFEEAFELFHRALYEIGVELGKEDKPVSITTSFYKILEVLHHIHPDVCLKEVNPEHLVRKFANIAQEHCLAYLESLSAPTTAMDYHSTNILLRQIRAMKNLSPIWDTIKPRVELGFWTECHRHYADNAEHPHLKMLYDDGSSLPAPDLHAIEESLSNSPGCQRFKEDEHTALLQLSSFNLFQVEQESIEADSSPSYKKACLK